MQRGDKCEDLQMVRCLSDEVISDDICKELER